MQPDRDTAEGMLFTDQYQLTMAQLYFAEGLVDLEVRFDYFFRKCPDYGTHRAGFCVFAGLSPLLDWVERTRATAKDLDHLRTQTGAGGPRFDGDFLGWLEEEGSFGGLDIHAVAEGRVVHPHEPLVSVRGPLAMAQILETALLNHLNYPTLVATKAARVAQAARAGAVLEFGTRRGPAWGANAGVRAALIGGAQFTSNVGVSHVEGIDPKGTHAHSMVQVFIARGGDELEAFRAYARAYPDNCLLLVDTVNTLESGLPNAITVFGELRAAGHEPVGIRLDSGDLATLAIESARRLDAAGFADTQIVLSSNLDELEIATILARIEEKAGGRGVDAAPLVSRLAYGVGTRLITSYGDPALGGVYKLAAVNEHGAWRPALKVSDSPAKMPIPGDKSLWRVYDPRSVAMVDVVGLADENVAARELETTPIFGEGPGRRFPPGEIDRVELLQSPVFEEGRRVVPPEDLETIRARRVADVGRLDEPVKDLVDPATYDVALTPRLKALQTGLIADFSPP